MLQSIITRYRKHFVGTCQLQSENINNFSTISVLPAFPSASSFSSAEPLLSHSCLFLRVSLGNIFSFLSLSLSFSFSFLSSPFPSLPIHPFPSHISPLPSRSESHLAGLHLTRRTSWTSAALGQTQLQGPLWFFMQKEDFVVVLSLLQAERFQLKVNQPNCTDNLLL